MKIPPVGTRVALVATLGSAHYTLNRQARRVFRVEFYAGWLGRCDLRDDAAIDLLQRCRTVDVAVEGVVVWARDRHVIIHGTVRPVQPTGPRGGLFDLY